MVFSSPIFLFLFLPVTLGVNFLLPRSVRNYWLLAVSLLFYAWGEPIFVAFMLLSVVMNYLFGMWVDAERSRPLARFVLVLTVVFNIGLLATYKYANFVVANLNVLLAHAGLQPIAMDHIPLPVGISFFTFQAMSYVIDVWRGEAERQKNPLDVALYVALFPQLIAGPIVRYRDVARQILHRVITRENFTLGVSRFLVGLGKKVLIANTLAVPADRIFALPLDQLTPGTAWLAVLCYTLQIYFDFSGYSDMAIGLGHMIGFHFLENFSFPYVSQTIREFWRRWHISLSTWFRDYLYIPMGGSRRSAARVHFNLITVFALCGLWHGASWTFVVWGLYHGAFQVFERLGLENVLARAWRPVRHLYTLLVAIVGWVLFRAETFPQALAFLLSMAGFAPGSATAQPGSALATPGGALGQSVWLYLNAEVALVFAVGCIGAMPVIPWLWEKRKALVAPEASRAARALDGALAAAHVIALLAVFVLCAMALSAGTYNPFIYYRF